KVIAAYMNFLKTFLASILGTVLGVLLLVLILVATIMSSSSEPEPYVRSNSVLTINLTGDIPARISPDPFEELFDPSVGSNPSLQSLKLNLEKAAADDNIKGVWVQTNQVLASWANLESAYNYFEDFKESGKFLYFSTDDIGMNEKAYFLASQADSVFSPRETGFEFDGFVAQLSFYRGFFDKIGLEPEVIRVGKYKSAVEPFMNNESSPESREQMNEILNSASDTFIAAIEKRTGKSVEEINDLLSTPSVGRLQFAVENGLIDELAYPDEVENHIKNRIGIEESEDLETISFGRYNKVSRTNADLDEIDTSDKIAVIYASGLIAPVFEESPLGPSAGINAKSVKNQLDSAVDDEDVKAIVFHVNSGGGAPSTSDMIWHYLREASESKPVIASMGSVAASGGYYIAAGADTIVASANTITGSIGIFSLLFNVEELYNDKLGIEFETLKTHEYADVYNFTRPFTPAERRVVEQNVENGYESFVGVVAESRGMTRDQVHEIAQGRVYTGTVAKEVGLVDEIGDLDRALEIAAEKAGIEQYNIDVYPKRKELFETLFSTANTKMNTWIRGWIPSEIQKEHDNIRLLINHPAGQNWALLPIQFDVN
ncbi:MAG: signal peptide peptidase SppA, partial [Balneolaceae bacterium]